MKILLTGGLGYIGSHTAVELLNTGCEVLILDNLSNSQRNVKEKIEQITNKSVEFALVDIRKPQSLRKLFKNHTIDAVIHFAGLKAVGESVQKPLEYYENNISGTINLLNVMREFGVKNFVFSSSATVYGQAEKQPITEDFPTGATNPYGRTKLFIEEILKDLYKSDPSFNIAILRYFNPVGAHPSGIIGENPKGIPNNLMPYIAKVSVGELEKLNIFGNDYNTKDGTGVRDYIHVVDLAKGHLCALNKLTTNPGLVIYNLGTGTGYSVLELVNTYNQVCGNTVKYEFAPRRPGDIDICYACPDKAKEELGWKAELTLLDMCQSAYEYQKSAMKKSTKNNKK